MFQDLFTTLDDRYEDHDCVLSQLAGFLFYFTLGIRRCGIALPYRAFTLDRWATSGFGSRLMVVWGVGEEDGTWMDHGRCIADDGWKDAWLPTDENGHGHCMGSQASWDTLDGWFGASSHSTETKKNHRGLGAFGHV